MRFFIYEAFQTNPNFITFPHNSYSFHSLERKLKIKGFKLLRKVIHNESLHYLLKMKKIFFLILFYQFKS